MANEKRQKNSNFVVATEPIVDEPAEEIVAETPDVGQLYAIVWQIGAAYSKSIPLELAVQEALAKAKAVSLDEDIVAVQVLAKKKKGVEVIASFLEGINVLPITMCAAIADYMRRFYYKSPNR